MSSEKKIFEANIFEANMFASGVWRGTGVDVTPSVEVVAAGRRIPYGDSPIELRQFAQRINDSLTTLETTAVSVAIVATEGSLLVKDSATTTSTFAAFSQGTSNQVLVSAGAGSNPVWTKILDGLTSVEAGGLTLAGGSITDTSGAISFGDENLTTTGTLGAGATTVTDLAVSGLARFTGTIAEAAQGIDRIDIGVENGTPRMVFEDAGNLIWEIDNSSGTFRWFTPGTARMSLTTTELILHGDSVELQFGAVQDYTIQWNATNAVHTISAGSFVFTGGDTIVDGLTDGTASLTGGSLTGVKLGSLTTNGLVQTSGGDGTLSIDTSVYLTAESDTLDSVADRGATTDQTLTAGGFITTGTLSAGATTVTSLVVGTYTIQSPAAANQVLISSAANVAAWSTAGNDKVLASNGAGAIAWTSKPFGYLIPANSAANEVYAGTGIGTAAWTTTLAGLTSVTTTILTDGTATLTGGSLTAVKLGSLTTNGLVQTTGGDGTLSIDTSVYLTAESDTLDTVADRGATTDQTLTAGGFVTGTLVLAGGSITDTGGAISFGNENLTTTGISTAKHFTAFAGVGNYSYKSVLQYNGSSATGTMKILLPVDWTNSMISIRIRGYDYTTGGTWEVLVGGYPYTGTPAWFNVGASISGANVPFDSVRLARDTSANKVCILLGTTSTSWANPQFDVDLSAGWTAQGSWNGTWAASIIASETGIANIVTCSLSRDVECQTVADKTLLSNADKTFSWYDTGLSDVLKIEVPSASGAERKYVLAADSGSKFAIESASWPLALTTNETIYVRTTGNDTTGNGSSGSPFLTLERTIEYLGGLYIGDYTIIVDIGEGVFTEAGTLSFQHPFGSQVTFQGVSEQITSQDTNSISASGTSLGYNNLYRYDVTFILPVGKSVSVGDYIGVTAVSGGTLPKALYGMHYVSGWVGGSRTATVQVVYRNGAPKASGTVTCTVDLVKTVIAFSNKNGMKISGPYYGGIWRGLVIQGDWGGSGDAKYGVWCVNGAVVSLSNDSSGDACGVVGFQNGIYAQNNSLVFADYVYVSKMGIGCCRAQNSGVINVRWAQLSGANNTGIYAFNGSTVAANSVKIVAVGNDSILSYQGSFIDAQSAYIDENNATNALRADRFAAIDATGATFSDAKDPAANPGPNGSYIIV